MSKPFVNVYCNNHVDICAWWRHQMETFSALLAFYHRSPVNSRPMTRSFDVSLICLWIHGWVNNHNVCDLRRHQTHNYVIVMGYTLDDKLLLSYRSGESPVMFILSIWNSPIMKQSYLTEQLKCSINIHNMYLYVEGCVHHCSPVIVPLTKFSVSLNMLLNKQPNSQ